MRFSSLATAFLFSYPTTSNAFVIPRTPTLSSVHTELYQSTRTDEAATKNELWKVERVDRISDWTTVNGHGNEPPKFPNPLSLKPNIPLSWFVDEDAAVAARVQIDAHETEEEHERGVRASAFELAGPRLDIHFDPQKSKAAIVTCGGCVFQYFVGLINILFC